MLIKNHCLSLLVLTGITLTTATSFANSSFTSLSDCRRHYNTSIQSGNESTTASDNWCKDRMTALDFCTEQALLNAMATNSYNASQIPEVRATLQNNCQRQLAEQATRNATPPVANTGVGTNTPIHAIDPGGVPRPPTPPAQHNCGALAASEQAACNTRLAQYQRDLQIYQSNLAAYNQRQAQAAEQARQQEQQQQQQRAQAGMQGMQMMLGAMAPALDGSDSPNSVNGVNIPEGYQARTITGPNGSTTTIIEPAPTSSGSNRSPAATTPAERAEVAASANRGNNPTDAAGVAGERAAAATDARSVANDPELQRAIDQNANAPQNPEQGNGAATQTNSGPGQQVDQEFQQIIQRLQQVKTQISASTASPPMAQSAAALEKIKVDLEKLRTEKKECSKLADRTEGLCLEGSSPGMKAAKALMDVSGPILAVVGSAQKACSSTRKITNLAALGVTMAKGVCVASKAMCEGSCSKAQKTVNDLLASVQSFDAKITQDINSITSACSPCTATTPCAPGCTPGWVADFETKLSHARGQSTQLQSSINAENGVTPGRNAGAIATCKKMGREILLMTTNIMGMMMAKQSAQKCEKQLASSAAAGSPTANVSTAEYCSAPETSGTQFCKCQSNPTAEGCPGSLAAGGLDPAQNNQRGVNLKAGQGVNGFAGGTRGGAGGTNFNLGGGSGTDANGAALANLQGGGSAFGGSSNALGSAVNGGGGGGAATPAAAAAAAGATPDKKWNFGSFAASGGGGTAARGGAAGGNGNISQQQQEAIERKIASDKYAAEVTPSSGASNFDKIKKVVRQISSTLDPNQ